MKKHQNIPPIAIKKSNDNKIWIAFGIIILLVTIIRVRLLSVPLERDEGEYAYMGQLILQGIPPYKIAFNMKFPGTYCMYALFMSIFGESIKGIHIGLLIVNISSIFLLFLLAKKLIGNLAALAAASVYALLSVSSSFLGFAGHATHYVILPALAGTYLLYKAITEDKKKYYFFSGLLLGLSPIMKQQGMSFCIFGGLILLLFFFIKKKSGIKAYLQRFGLFIIGGIIPFLLMIIILKMCGVFDKFLFWTLEYSSAYVNQVPINQAFGSFKFAVSLFDKAFWFIWIIAGLGLIFLFIHPKFKKDFRTIFILLFFIFSFISICPGFYFRQHYFITLLPAVAILFGVFIDYIFESSKDKKSKIIKYTVYALFIIPIALGFFAERNYFFKYDKNVISRMAYGLSPFPESINIARYIRTNSKDNDKIAILGSEPQICFYAKRHSATGYIYAYPLMEVHKNSLKMQKEMIQEIELAKPKYLIYIHISTSWMATPNSTKYIFDWINPFLQNNHYKIIGIADIFSDKTIYQWDNDAFFYHPRSEFYVQIFEKKI